MAVQEIRSIFHPPDPLLFAALTAVTVTPYFIRYEKKHFGAIQRENLQQRLYYSTTAIKLTMAPKVWLITGCSSGFGREIALAALKHNDRVVATARDPSKLGDLSARGALTFALDVCASDAQLQKVVTEILEVTGQIDILVNNAGYILTGAVEECR